MKRFPAEIQFKYPWRSYQQRVLDNLQKHLTDNKLHVVAPPGSGKTVLGLEVMLRLNRPTLILAPTVAIRNQWVDRFCELFLNTDQVPDWISYSLFDPKFVTVSTYQGLFASFSRMEESSEDLAIDNIEEVKVSKRDASRIVALLKQLEVKTLIVDEAHHLKNEWWKALNYVVQEIKPTVVGLTATPPYDVTISEWSRYCELNGPIDEEIFVPELVLAGDLCPHQDFIYFNIPKREESKTILDNRARINEIYEKLKSDITLLEDIEGLSFMQSPKEYLYWIYDNLEFYMACVIYVHQFRSEINDEHLLVLGNRTAKVPTLNYDWMQKLLEFYCFKSKPFFVEDERYTVEEYEEKVEHMLNRLRRYGAMSNKLIRFTNSLKENTLLSSSVNKLNSIVDIVEFEKDCLGADLRMVILSDFIRKEYHVSSEVNDVVHQKLGVVPIFEQIRRRVSSTNRLGVLTGSLIIMPLSAKNRFTELLHIRKVDEVMLKPLMYDGSYVEVSLVDRIKNDIISIITRLFEEGEIEVLIGTKSLLGEGWDAPAINSLILASFVGSYVSSNQMRGRAIRAQRDNPLKTANIWHLVTFNADLEDGGSDRKTLIRRFKSFVGVSNHECIDDVFISNGTARLGLSHSLLTEDDIKEQNSFTYTVASDRSNLMNRWLSATQKGQRLVHAIGIPFAVYNSSLQVNSVVFENSEDARVFYTNKTLAHLKYSYRVLILGTLVNCIAFALQYYLFQLSLYHLLYFALEVIVFAYFLKIREKRKRYSSLARKYVDIGDDIAAIAKAVTLTLERYKLILTPFSELDIVVKKSSNGGVSCSLEGGTVLEGNLFSDCIQELFSPIENPRYVIERRTFLALKGNFRDYHAVPTCLGVRKEMVSYFSQKWSELVGENRIIFTRTVMGRSKLLSARVNSLSNKLDNEPLVDENIWV
ncbi:DEAD/DEAH box helicase family protein [Myroides albus]|uniref:DEAD/DEAH box helicase n=1 Tax=Myroides albus TaxID=2562892 RepID=A0A6I3LEK8_9FLAO|nr:DEAD/DEAH box helicase family protein [Myroides albus]MTG96908.1 DEAD/DEAH box helicase [Myroides albus]UVD78342.1 DEAD/DEAH box helicase family protein [Myroides albus]